MMFVITSVCAVLAAIARMAGNGGQFAGALLTAAVFLVACFVVFLVLFLLAWRAAVFRRIVGMADILLAIALAIAELAGVRFAGFSLFPVIAFLLASGGCILLVPHRDPDLRSDNPFADGQLPPQIMSPRERPL
ncbi:hypothetical protein K239x_35030 [Planctomycetes bacterium K23_9]|uniref:Uncharacterized protein n=2 Tax=Stieleria marina TaxID=1930275 RepID=A0A517NWK1_9BACT|nr:hypothetical protein K239x_35030 [Planctomycetes bacterium K23_9]